MDMGENNSHFSNYIFDKTCEDIPDLDDPFEFPDEIKDELV